MKQLEQVSLVQFYLFGATNIPMGAINTIAGPNGSGKSTILDAIQIVLTGLDKRFFDLNAKSPSDKRLRTVRDYCLGYVPIRNVNGESARPTRSHAMSYILLGFGDEESDWRMTAGVCVYATEAESDHEVLGRFVLPGVLLQAEDCIEQRDSGRIPLDWKRFERRAAERCQQAGKSPEFSSQAGRFVERLLFHVSGGLELDPIKFQSALKKSLSLRDIDKGVDDFIRNHLIPVGQLTPDHLDAFAGHMRELYKLKHLIRDTEEQLGILDGIEKRYADANSALRNLRSLEVVVARYRVERVAFEVDDLREQMEAADSKAKAKAEAIKKARTEIVQLKREQSETQGLIQADESIARGKALQEQVNNLGEQMPYYRRRLDDSTGQVLRWLTPIEREQVEGISTARVGEVREALERLRQDWLAADADDARRRFGEAVEIIERSQRILEGFKSESYALLGKLKEDKQAIQGRLKRLQEGGASVGDNAARLIDVLHDQGIEAAPVCDRLRVTRKEWQPAIEAYLGRRLEDLLIADRTRCQEAVAVMRHAKPAIYGVTLVQPTHLNDQTQDASDPSLVASVLDSDDPVALAYIREGLRGVRFAETEADLANYKRALTRDGMASSGGGTRRMKLPGEGELLIGQRRDEQAIRELERRLLALDKQYADEEEAFQTLSRFTGLAQDAPTESFATDLAELQRLHRSCERARTEAESITSERGEALLAELREIEKRINTTQSNITDWSKEQVRQEERANAFRGKFQEKEQELRTCQKAETAACENSDYDAEIADRYQADIDDKAADDDDKITMAETRAKTNQDNHNKAVADACQALALYNRDHNLDLHDELKPENWHKGAAWVTRQATHLRDTTLAEYREQAELASEASQETFRTDVAVNLNADIQRMEREIDDLNRVLKNAPAFTNGERYRFRRAVKSEHAALRAYIKKIAETPEGGLFEQDAADDPAIQKAEADLYNLMEDAAQAESLRESIPAALTDYREFFSFDLDILDESDQVVDRLSKRVGKGSGGEHCTPFYVVAGAALASAYRLDRQNNPGGLGIMLLDEAFAGMDLQNTEAAGRFLRSLGLQLIMAAPSTEKTKLASISDVVYDIARYGRKVKLERETVKPEGRKLLTSDMPSINENLLPEMEQRIHEELAHAERGNGPSQAP